MYNIYINSKTILKISIYIYNCSIASYSTKLSSSSNEKVVPTKTPSGKDKATVKKQDMRKASQGKVLCNRKI